MADLDPAHVEAVARLLHDGNPNSGTSWGDKNGFQRSPYRVRARQILTSTDPAVHAALLAVPAVQEALANAWDEGYDAWPSAAGKAGNHYRYGHPPTGGVDA